MGKYDDFMKVVEQRTSCRSYDGRDVSDDDLTFCLEAARLAPSACNKQPWRFIIVRDPALRKEICSGCLLPGIPMPWLASAPVIVVLGCEIEVLTHRIAPFLSGVPYQYIDCGIAGEHFVLAAESLELGTCWIGWFKPRKVKKLLKLPSSFKVLSLISLGHPLQRSDVRARKPITEIAAFDGYFE